jgi:hypothetical protein
MADAAWPEVRKKKFTAITLEEHARIVEREQNPERKLYYEMLWETGGSQADIASLHCDQVNLETETIRYSQSLAKSRAMDSLCSLTYLSLRLYDSSKLACSGPLLSFCSRRKVGLIPRRLRRAVS